MNRTRIESELAARELMAMRFDNTRTGVNYSDNSLKNILRGVMTHGTAADAVVADYLWSIAEFCPNEGRIFLYGDSVQVHFTPDEQETLTSLERDVREWAEAQFPHNNPVVTTGKYPGTGMQVVLQISVPAEENV